MRDPRLQVRDPLGNRIVRVDRSPFRIGRRETNDLMLPGAEVSREHAEIAFEGGRYLLRDRNSRYGTFVAGEPVVESELQSGDQIRLGRGAGADLVFLGGEEDSSGSSELTPHARDGLREITELLKRLQKLGPGRLLQDVLSLVLDAALQISGAKRGLIMLATPDGALEFRLARTREGEMLPDPTLEISRKIPEAVFRTGQTRVERDLLEDVRRDHEETVELGIRYVVCVPLNVVRTVESGEPSAEDRRIGVLYLDSHARGKLLSQATQSNLETLAAEASAAIESARLYREMLEKARVDQELRIAAQIQKALLPPPHVGLAYLEASAASIPCRSIGGDFYDYLGQAGPAFGFTLGDVAGKGPPAALLSAMMQGMFAFASRTAFATPPAATLAAINAALCDRAVEQRFVTLFFGVLTDAGQLSYCNAGHNPPFVVGPSGVRRLRAGGPIVGLFDFARFDQETVALEAGETVVVFSDGVSEARNAADEEFGETRLLETIERTGTTDAQALVDGIVDALRAFTRGVVQYDDITLLVIRYLGQR